MTEREGPAEAGVSVESLHRLRLLALLHDTVRSLGQARAAEELGIDRKTIWRGMAVGRLTPRLAESLEQLLLSRERSEAARQRERADGLERRVQALEEELHGSLEEIRGEVGAVQEKHAHAMQAVGQRLAQAEGRGRARDDGGGGSGTGVQPAGSAVARREFPDLVTREPLPGDEEVFGDAWSLVAEWRVLRDRHPAAGSGLSWLVDEQRVLELEVAMIEDFGLTLPPEKRPLGGPSRRAQLSWRQAALDDARRARARWQLLRWVRRALTLGLWWK